MPEVGPPCVLALEAHANAYGRPPVRAVLRAAPEDFVVDEVLGFEPEGAGEHVLVQVRKRGLNTEEVARRLARLAGVAPRAVGYAGLKDRHAVTTQWLSVGLAGAAEPDWGALGSEDLQVLRAERHRRKLRRGSHRANRFELTLRELIGELDSVSGRLERMAAHGVPNYFGEQRFGREAANLDRAYAMFRGARVRDRHRRGLYLSAARALLFNRVLSERVAAGSWDRPVPGDVMMLAGSRSRFTVERPDEAIEGRMRAGDLHPTGPLWGRGDLSSVGRAAELERRALAGCEVWCAGLEVAGLEQDRRALRLLPEGLAWESRPDGVLVLRLTLPRGAYATSVLRELIVPA